MANASNNLQSVHNQSLALAGILQAVTLVDDIATSGSVDSQDELTCLHSVINLSPDNPEQVYGGASNLNTGFRWIQKLLNNPTNEKNLVITKYTGSILMLQRSLQNNPGTWNQLGNELSAIESKQQHHLLSHEELISTLAECYKRHISPLTPRIMVKGKPHLLSQDQNVFRVRALLLASLRSAVLWQQCGGSKWKLLIHKGQYVKSASSWLQSN